MALVQSAFLMSKTFFPFLTPMILFHRPCLTTQEQHCMVKSFSVHNELQRTNKQYKNHNH